jgi:hypothetical protein
MTYYADSKYNEMEPLFDKLSHNYLSTIIVIPKRKGKENAETHYHKKET